jgi:uncharacterized membrane protein
MIDAAVMLGAAASMVAMICAVVLIIRQDQARRDRVADEHAHDRALLAELERHGR